MKIFALALFLLPVVALAQGGGDRTNSLTTAIARSKRMSPEKAASYGVNFCMRQLEASGRTGDEAFLRSCLSHFPKTVNHDYGTTLPTQYQLDRLHGCIDGFGQRVTGDDCPEQCNCRRWPNN